MPVWTHADMLKYYHVYRDKYINAAGLYEIGFVRSGIFNPMYLGMSRCSIYRRLHAHYTGVGNIHIRDYYWDVKKNWMYWRRERDNLYFHVQRTSSGMSAVREARLLLRHEWGKSGYYEWNRKGENLEAALRALEDEAEDE